MPELVTEKKQSTGVFSIQESYPRHHLPGKGDDATFKEWFVTGARRKLMMHLSQIIIDGRGYSVTVKQLDNVEPIDSSKVKTEQDAKDYQLIRKMERTSTYGLMNPIAEPPYVLDITARVLLLDADQAEVGEEVVLSALIGDRSAISSNQQPYELRQFTREPDCWRCTFVQKEVPL